MMFVGLRRLGRTALAGSTRSHSRAEDQFLATLDQRVAARVPGTAIFLSSMASGVPMILEHHIARIHALHERVVLLTIAFAHVPYIPAGERVEIDLNLRAHEIYESPYTLGYHQFRREYFSIVHSGEGDGWDMHRPAMGSVLVYQGRLFLIDASPNLLYALTALGIGVNEIDGIFHTHSHDDHFAGLTTLLQTDHRIKYFATPFVRAAVTTWKTLRISSGGFSPRKCVQVMS